MYMIIQCISQSLDVKVKKRDIRSAYFSDHGNIAFAIAQGLIPHINSTLTIWTSWLASEIPQQIINIDFNSTRLIPHTGLSHPSATYLCQVYPAWTAFQVLHFLCLNETLIAPEKRLLMLGLKIS